MLVLLRIIFTGLFLYWVYLAREASGGISPTKAGDLTPAYYLAIAVILGIATGITWAPFFGEKLSGPLTGTFVEGNAGEIKGRLLKLARSCERRHRRRMAVFFCFCEGVHRPWLPAAFVFGMHNSKPGSWLEKIFAREVYRFDNVKHCVEAHAILKRHGENPGAHPRPEVNLTLYSLQRDVRPDTPPLEIPPAPPMPPLKRNPRIRLFQSKSPPQDQA